jgi:hypothetical protein
MAACVNCGAQLRPGAAFCAGCGSAAPARQSLCPSCGQKLADPSRHCSYCGAAPVGAETEVEQGMPTGAFAPPASLGNPGIGIAGFVLSLLGVSLIGLILSWIGYREAQREGRPSGLSLAGIIIGAVGLVIMAIVVIAYIALIASLTSAAGPSYGY